MGLCRTRPAERSYSSPGYWPSSEGFPLAPELASRRIAAASGGSAMTSAAARRCRAVRSDKRGRLVLGLWRRSSPSSGRTRTRQRRSPGCDRARALKISGAMKRRRVAQTEDSVKRITSVPEKRTRRQWSCNDRGKSARTSFRARASRRACSIWVFSATLTGRKPATCFSVLDAIRDSVCSQPPHRVARANRAAIPSDSDGRFRAESCYRCA